MKTKMMMVCLVLGSSGAFSQKMDQDMVVFKDAKLGTAHEHYIHVKDALVASKSDEAKNGASSELQKALNDVSSATAAIEAASEIAGAPGLVEQRKVFSTLEMIH